MRFPVLCVWMMAVAQCFAGEGFAGTKSGAAASGPAPAGTGMPAMLQMLLALGVVLVLLKVVLPKLASRLNKQLVTGAASSLRIEESASFAGGSLYVVRARRKTLLLAVSGNGVSCLSDLTEPTDLLPPETFQEVLEQAPDAGEAHAYAVVEEIEGEEGLEMAEALRRLDRLARS